MLSIRCIFLLYAVIQTISATTTLAPHGHETNETNIVGTTTIRPRFTFAYYIVDFALTKINKGDIIVVSGCITKSTLSSKPRRFYGTPIFYSKHGTFRTLQSHEILQFQKLLVNLTRCHPEVGIPLSSEFVRGKSISYEYSNLNTEFFDGVLHDKKKAVLVFWNGRNEMRVMRRFRSKNVYKIFNVMNSRAKENSTEFILRLLDSNRMNHIIYEKSLGLHPDVKAPQLTLDETHNLICLKNHSITMPNDPLTDVILTRCVFNFVRSQIDNLRLYTETMALDIEPERLRKYSIRYRKLFMNITVIPDYLNTRYQTPSTTVEPE